MTPDKVDELIERVAWLGREMVRILWLLISMTSRCRTHGCLCCRQVARLALNTCSSGSMVHGRAHFCSDKSLKRCSEANPIHRSVHTIQNVATPRGSLYCRTPNRWGGEIRLL